MKKFNYLSFVLSLVAFTACQEEDFGYKSYEPDKENTEYSLRFANRDAVKVSISTETPGAPYFIYFSNPYDAEGNFTGTTAYLQGRTPIETTLSVPRHVDSLYVVSPMRPMRVLAAGDVKIEDANLLQTQPITRVDISNPPYLPTNATGTYWRLADVNPVIGRNPDITDGVMNYVNSCFPSGQENISEEQVRNNTDLTLPTNTKEEYVAIWVTYLGKGENDPDCNIWLYYYDSSATDLTISSVKFIGRSEGKLVEFTVSGKGNPNLPTPLISSNNIASSDLPQTLFLGYIKKGYNIGFCYQMADAHSQNAKCRFTTPKLNEEAVQGSGRTGGVIINKEIDGHEYNFVGFERVADKTGGSGTILADNDFNDALLCVETNPQMHPSEDVPVTPTIEKTVTKGYYLFEDLNGSASSNDNDFNDVVIYYEKAIYNLGTAEKPQWMCDFLIDHLANACMNTNALGVYHKATDADETTRTFVMCTAITGEKNMEIAPAFDGKSQQSISFSLVSANDVILPFLRSVPQGETYNYVPTSPQATSYDANRYNIYCTTYATSGFPYAIEVPFAENNPFLWTKEGVKITNAYSNWNSKDWYTAPSDASAVVPRAEGTTKY